MATPGPERSPNLEAVFDRLAALVPLLEDPGAVRAFDLGDGSYAVRRLTSAEQERLEAQGNVLHEEVFVAESQPGAAAEGLGGIRQCSFHGGVVLLFAGERRGRLEDSDFRQVLLDMSATVRRCESVARVFVDRDASVWDCSYVGLRAEADGAVVALPRGLRIETGPEVGSGRFAALLGLGDTYEAALEKLMAPGAPELDGKGEHVTLSYIGPECLVHRCDAVDACVLLGGNQVHRSTLDRVVCAPGVIVGSQSTLSQVFMQEGSSVGDRGATMVDNTFLFRGATVTNGARVSSCVLAPEVHLEAIEATCSWVGPSIGMHHNGLLIACLWPEGRGNVACGALVGSNHTGRAPDTWMWAGEGVFVGLGALVKYPQTLIEAPYSLVASGVMLPPQRMQVPFSLVCQATTSPGAYRRTMGSNGNRLRAVPLGAPRLLPAWVLRYSMYTVLRNEAKFRSRTKVLPASGVVPGVLRDATVRLCIGATRRITAALAKCRRDFEAANEPSTDEALTDVALMGSDVPGLGACWCLWRDCLHAIDDFNRIAELHAMRTFLGYVEAVCGQAQEKMHCGHGAFDPYLPLVCDADLLPGPALDDDYPGAWRRWLWKERLDIDVKMPISAWKVRGQDILAALPPLERSIFDMALRSKQRDDIKGCEITPLYEEGANMVSEVVLDKALQGALDAVATTAARVEEAVKVLSAE